MNKPNNNSHNSNSNNNSNNSNNKRSRGRNNANAGRRPQNSGNRSFESNGPEVKVRGSASQICDKYLTLAHDASLSGDRVRAESLLQHAEHYYRIVNGGDDARTENPRQAGGVRRGRGPGEISVSGEMEADVDPQQQSADPATMEQPSVSEPEGQVTSEPEVEPEVEAEGKKEARPSRRDRARTASTAKKPGRRSAAAKAEAASKEADEATQEEATVESTVVQAVQANEEPEQNPDEAIVIAEPVHRAEPTDDDAPESEVA